MTDAGPVSLKYCTVIDTPLRDPIHLEPTGRVSRGERRRRSLRRGIALWHADACARARPRRSVLLLALTFRDDDPMAARGAILQFWRAYRSKFGKRLYFSWAELQRRGAVHYHALLYDPPWTLRRHAAEWIQAHWPHADIQPNVQFRDYSWFVAKSGSYVRKYASTKFGNTASAKSYQQEYDELPREIRTWECNRLAHPVRVVLEHTDRPVIVNLNPFAPWPIRRLHWWLISRQVHCVPAAGRCSLALTKKRLRISPNLRSRREDSGVTTTKGSPSD